jgi:membrane-bound lytic murein transglycosylase D
MTNDNEPPGRSPRRLLATALISASALLAGCQSFGPERGEASDAAPTAPPVEPTMKLVSLPVPFIPRREPLEVDLLARIRAELSLPGTDDPAVAREREWYAAHQPYLDRVFARAEPYLFYIAEALEERGMPADLALLPIVESAFDPFAYSHGRAAGLWQIIPGTGKRLGLEQDWWFDGRRDVLESTRAALDYLAELHERFGGDWLLAVAGYNSGEGNVVRALRRAATAGRSADFWGIKSYLPIETRTYVPRLLAIRDLVADPAKHGVSLPALANEPRFEVVETGGQIDMALAAELAGIDTDRLYALNAGVNRWATAPDGPHRLLVPIGHGERFDSGLAALGERARVQWTRHRVRQGETIGGLAEKYQTTAAVLREVNGLRGNLIRAGDHLMIPHALKAMPSYTQSAESRAARQQSTERNGVRRAHVVQPGESLWSISQAYGVNVRSLASWNSMAPGDVLSVGRDLVVWTKAAAAGGAEAQPARSAVTGGNDRVRQVTYVVRRGDSLSSIARRFRVGVQKLVEWNNVQVDKYLQPGQRLTMYVNVTEQSG